NQESLLQNQLFTSWQYSSTQMRFPWAVGGRADTGINGFREPASRRREAPEPATAIEKADVTAAEANDMVAGLELGNADELTDQRFGDEDLAAFPLDRARRPYAADLMIGIVPGLLDTIGHRTRRGRVELVRRPLAQCLVRSLLVVMTAEGIKA